MTHTNQSEIIRQSIEALLKKGMEDKQDIYSKIVEELGVPRPTVRRCARELKNEYEARIKILQSEIPKPEIPTIRT